MNFDAFHIKRKKNGKKCNKEKNICNKNYFKYKVCVNIIPQLLNKQENPNSAHDYFLMLFIKIILNNFLHSV